MTRRHAGISVLHLGVGCDEIRQAMSARFDEELSDLAGGVVSAHVDGCDECRRVQLEMSDLARRSGVTSPRPVPEGLVPMLSEVLREDLGSQPASTKARPWREVVSPRRMLRWGVAAAPVLVLSVALPLGAGANPRLVPSHLRTPCTAGLHFAHGGPGR
ncbi:MAG TPA: zf-HC2 domain-containing protein [Acidimicrobiales bacterium]|nr:zf-HC2 domain-containing protein [Acidimicrobiales bacterium]